MYKDIQNKVSKKVAVHTSFYEIINLGESQFNLVNQKVGAYNTSLPQNIVKDSLGRTRAYTKGKIGHGAINLARQLIYLCVRQMEELRTSPENDKYLNYLDENSDSYPITTNNGKLAKALGSIRCKNTIHNYIDLLIEAGIILKKNNTSRRKREIIEDGYKTIVVDLMPNGRGDFCLWLSKEVFAQRYRYLNVENSPTGALKRLPVDPSTQAGNNANAAFSDNQIQKLGQCYTPETETNKINTNNCLENSEYGAATQPIVSSPTSNEVELEDRNEQNKKNPTKNQGAARPSRKEQYRIRIEAQKRAAKVLDTGSNTEYYSQLLYFQLIHLLYPQLTPVYLEKAGPAIQKLLQLHLKRLDLPLFQAFQKVSRGIYLAHRFVQTHENAFVYEPFTYLRIDGAFTKGTLMYVIDKWVKEEADRLKLNAEEQSHLLKWQKAQGFSEDLFKDVLFTLKGNYSAATDTFKVSLKRLDEYFKVHGIPEKTRIKIRRYFADRCLAIFQEVQNIVQETEDPIWKNFQQFRRINNQ